MLELVHCQRTGMEVSMPALIFYPEASCSSAVSGGLLMRVEHPEHDDLNICNTVVDGKGEDLYRLYPDLIVLNGGSGGHLYYLGEILIYDTYELKTETL